MSPQPRIRTAVIPVAGLGTRFLPATKAVPKELLPIVDVPAIQVIIEEAVEAGIEQIILIIGRGKAAIMDHFDTSYELEDTLRRRGQDELIGELERISDMVRPIYVRQKAPLGLGHAVLCAQHIVGDNPFVVMLPDDLIDAPVAATAQLINRFEKYNAGVVALQEVPREDVSRYGIIAGERMSERTWRINTLIEKPTPEAAPSRLAVIGRYVLPGRIFGYLAQTRPGHGGEIQLTDALQALARDQGLVGHEFQGVRHDIGDKLGFLKASVSHALRREDLGPEFRAFLKSAIAKD